jgi:AhpD family alkylhydroperoxidase
MRRKLVQMAVEASARRIGGDTAYIMSLYEISPRVLKRLGAAVKMLSHREIVPIGAAYAAQLAGALAEGCGSCVQIHINMARAAGVDDSVIASVLLGDLAALPFEAVLAIRFARALIERSEDEPLARRAVQDTWGGKGVVDLAVATQVSRFLSMLKFGFGHATSCEVLSVGDRQLAPAVPT